MPFIQEVSTIKPNGSITASLNESLTNSTKPKGKALNFTIHNFNPSAQKLDQHRDLSDVSMDDEDEDDIDIDDHDSLNSKSFPQKHKGIQ